MAKTQEPLTQLATRIPKSLHRQLKLHCIHTDTSVTSVMTSWSRLSRRSARERGAQAGHE
jgi:hypothetical protein